MKTLKMNLINKMIIIISILCLLSISLSAINAAETNLTSSDNLGQTIENASNGDTINLDTGTYTNNVTNISINKNLTIQGKNPTTTIDAQKLGRIFSVTSGNTLMLINITLINGNAITGGAIYNEGGRLTITNCNFINNNASYQGGAILSFDTDNTTINNSNFINNYGESGGAIYSNTVENMIITNSNFTNNSGEVGGGVFVF